MEIQKIKWGIIGLGNIANQFAADLKLLQDAELVAVASRNIDKANEFAQQYNSTKAYDSYDTLFEDENVDIIYIATPHNSHAELSIKALENGKHVLCEKPIALSYKDAVRMIETSKKYNKFFMEAFWTRFIPSVQDVFSKVQNGEIGAVNYIKADFAFIGNETEGSRLFTKNSGGGALFDIGVYPLFLSYIMLGIPKEIIAKSIFHKNEIDLQTSMILNYDNAHAVLHASIASESDMKAVIGGTKGRIELNTPWFMANGYSIFKEEKESVFSLPNLGKGYSYEAIECHNCIRNNQIESKLWSHHNSLDLSKMVEEVKNQIGFLVKAYKLSKNNMGRIIIKMEDLSIADLKAAYDFNALERKRLKKLLKKSKSTLDYNSNADYQELMVVEENLYRELEKRINSIEMIW